MDQDQSTLRALASARIASERFVCDCESVLTHTFMLVRRQETEVDRYETPTCCNHRHQTSISRVMARTKEPQLMHSESTAGMPSRQR